MKKSKYIKFLCSFLIAALLLTLYSGDFAAKANKKIDTVPPTSPTNLTAIQIGETSAVLTWTASYDAKGVASYLIYKNGINIASVKTVTFTATGLSPSATYSFYVRAKCFTVYTSGSKSDSLDEKFIHMLEEKGAQTAYRFNCRGFDTFGPFKLVGGLQKGHPDEVDLDAAARFGRHLLSE